MDKIENADKLCTRLQDLIDRVHEFESTENTKDWQNDLNDFRSVLEKEDYSTYHLDDITNSCMDLIIDSSALVESLIKKHETQEERYNYVSFEG